MDPVLVRHFNGSLVLQWKVWVVLCLLFFCVVTSFGFLETLEGAEVLMRSVR